MRDGAADAHAPALPPRLRGLAAGPSDPFAVAQARARHGVDAGLLVWSLTEDRLRAALVLAPDEPLATAVAALPACMTGFRDAFGVLAPPASALQLGWGGELRLNGARAGAFRACAALPARGEVPRWMVVDWTLELRFGDGLEPGEAPERTALDQEGCGEVAPLDLLGAYARHALHWLDRLDEPGGRVALGRAWEGLLWARGEEVEVPGGEEPATGRFLGIDEGFGMLLKSGGRTRAVPLAAVVERA